MVLGEADQGQRIGLPNIILSTAMRLWLLTAALGSALAVNGQRGAVEYLTHLGEEGKPHIVLISGDEEYRSEEALPQLAKILSTHHGFNCTVLFAQDPEHPGVVDPNYRHNIPGLEQLDTADLMVIFTRFRALPDDQMKYIDDYLLTGKPVLGIRTATHAFRFNDVALESSYKHYGNYYEVEGEWNGGFGKVVLGENWVAHHGKHGHQSTRGVFPNYAGFSPLWRGIEKGTIWGPTDVYAVRLGSRWEAYPILLGQVVDRQGAYDESDPLLGMRPTDEQLAGPAPRRNEEGTEVKIDLNDPMMPIAWTRRYQLPDGEPGFCFATTIGASVDLLAEGTRRLMVNAVYSLLDLEIPRKANVDIVGPYGPSRFGFYDDAYWDERNIKIEELK